MSVRLITGAARRADAILATPPQALSALSTEDLETLRRILRSAS